MPHHIVRESILFFDKRIDTGEDLFPEQIEQSTA